MLVGATMVAVVIHGVGCGGPRTVQDQRTAEGAQTGAAVGAVGGVLIGLIGGDRRLGDAALAGAAVGAAAGATAGAISGGVEDAELKEKIGERNFEGLMYLVNCQHGKALRVAEEEQNEGSEPKHRLAALWLEVLTTADMEDAERLAEVQDLLVDEDPKIETADDARRRTKRALLEVRDIRVEMGKGRKCR